MYCVSADTTTSGTEREKPKPVIQIIYFTSFSIFKQSWCTTMMPRSVNHRASKQRSYTSIPSWLTWCGKIGQKISVQRRQKALIWRDRKDKSGKNVNILNLTRNSRVCHFDKEQIRTDGYTSGDPLYSTTWNNQRKPLVQGKLERHRSAKPRMSLSAAT